MNPVYTDSDYLEFADAFKRGSLEEDDSCDFLMDYFLTEEESAELGRNKLTLSRIGRCAYKPELTALAEKYKNLINKRLKKVYFT